MSKMNSDLAANRSINSTHSSNKNKMSSKASEYRWVGKGEHQPDGTVVYNAVEVTVAGRKSLIRCGDSALLSSNNGEEPEDEMMQLFSEISGTNSRGEEEEGVFYGSHTDEGFLCIGAFDPFVAVIVKMWEIPPINKAKGQRKSIVDDDLFDDERKARMRIRARWYLKVRNNVSLSVVARCSIELLWCSAQEEVCLLLNY
jgi:hypothetical protein